MQQQPPSLVTTSPNISDLLISPKALLKKRPDIHNIICGAVVFRESHDGPHDPVPEVLLLKRAASDSFALKWETPGGTADLNVDQSMVDVVVRELWEETQLRARRISCTVGLGLPAGVDNIESLGEVTDARMDKEYNLCLLSFEEETWAIGTFVVDVEDTRAQIVLRDDEHVEWAWVSETEIDRRQSRSGQEMAFVSEAMRMTLLEAFRLKREGRI